MDDLLADFLTETNESLAELDVALVRLEQTPDDEATLSLIFRLVHTIKGTCGFLGLPRLERVAHASENVLGRVRDKILAVTPDIITTILQALDRIKQIVAHLGATGAEMAGNDDPLVAELNAIAEGRAGAASAPAAVDVSAPLGTETVTPTVEGSDVKATKQRKAKRVAKPRAVRPAAPAAAIAAAHPVDEDHAPAAQPATVPVAAAAPASVEPTAQGPAPAGAAPAPAGAEAAIGSQTIRVGVDVLENLMTLVSELVLTRNQLLQLGRAQEGQAAAPAGFAAPLQRLSQITSDLQEGVVKTRMQPVGNAWNKLPRLVRDLARELGKSIDLRMLGAETELDRQVLELIKDPLTHMVRNSADHGIETPAERLAAGKAETGRIALNAYHEGGHVLIEIADDGRGLSLDRIRAKALAKGLATEAEIATMTEVQIQRFVFRAGFSTAAAITAVSGRGVGMDVVKTNIEQIGGTVDLKSVEGAGTTFTVKIPLTLAIVSALIVEAGGERFAIPQISVQELVRARAAHPGDATATGTGLGGPGLSSGGAKDAGKARGAADPAESAEALIEMIDRTPVLRLRAQLLPLVDLDHLLRLGRRKESAGGEVHVVVAQVGASTLGIIVDRVFDTEEIVVKPVAPILRHLTMFSGNTILGDGSVIMILDPNGIARATGIAGGTTSAGDAQPGDKVAAGEDRPTMLLFRAGSEARMAVPLSLIARIEDIPRDRVEFSGGMPVTQYQGGLMPLIPLTGGLDLERARFAVLVFASSQAAGAEQCVGLVVDEIIDVVEEAWRVQLTGARPGLLGTAVIGGFTTDVIDADHWLAQAHGDWFGHANAFGGGGAYAGNYDHALPDFADAALASDMLAMPAGPDQFA